MTTSCRAYRRVAASPTDTGHRASSSTEAAPEPPLVSRATPILVPVAGAVIGLAPGVLGGRRTDRVDPYGRGLAPGSDRPLHQGRDPRRLGRQETRLEDHRTNSPTDLRVRPAGRGGLRTRRRDRPSEAATAAGRAGPGRRARLLQPPMLPVPFLAPHPRHGRTQRPQTPRPPPRQRPRHDSAQRPGRREGGAGAPVFRPLRSTGTGPSASPVLRRLPG